MKSKIEVLSQNTSTIYGLNPMASLRLISAITGGRSTVVGITKWAPAWQEEWSRCWKRLQLKLLTHCNNATIAIATSTKLKNINININMTGGRSTVVGITKWAPAWDYKWSRWLSSQGVQQCFQIQWGCKGVQRGGNSSFWHQCQLSSPKH